MLGKASMFSILNGRLLVKGEPNKFVKLGGINNQKWNGILSETNTNNTKLISELYNLECFQTLIIIKMSMKN